MGSKRSLAVRFCFGVMLRNMFAVAFVVGGAIAQDSAAPRASTPALNATSATSSATSDSFPVDLKPDATGAVPPQQIRELLRRAEEKDMENDRRLRDYTYLEREERHHLDNRGEVKKVESRTSEILEIYGEPVERLTAKDDQPLAPDEAKKEDDKIQKIIDKRKTESEEERRKRLAKEEKEREDDRKFVLEIADAFNFRLVGSEAIEGRDTWVIEGEPRPGYEAQNREARILSKFKGRVWIDKTEEQLVKLDVVAIDTISFGFVLARIHKGTHAVIEMTKVNDEVWLPKHVQFHVDARVALFKNYDEDIEQSFRDYRKFRTDTKITVVGEENRE
ncbi:MAG: hypothetical protein WA718_21700 [Terriglobales bacterium]